ncbi:hypothetical protein [Corallococcus terminator]|uniref:Uncharacterized protein n=1 Tax=Corallococcus terminator TaxID=2316733 RepID=A0A3A8HN57_9BACT|nr:hypothetical protein [Corallococcus terminator]RKG67301.1 hypothetical protein D7V88_41155 [Corallococcus terminator]
MRKLGIPTGLKIDGSFVFDGGQRRFKIQEGRAPLLRMVDDMGQLPAGTLLFGHILWGEYIYGRFTEARTEKGVRYPVCIEMLDGFGIEHGMPVLSGSTNETAIIMSTVYLRAVDQFE